MSGAIYYETFLLAASLAVGIGPMIAYDGLRLFRALVPHGTLWTGLEDAGYWLLSSGATFLLLFYQNDGILRWYAIGGVLLGMTAYNVTVSRFYRKLLKKTAKYFTMKKRMRRGRRPEREEQVKEKRPGSMSMGPKEKGTGT